MSIRSKFLLVSVIIFILALILSINTNQQNTQDIWFNASWHYRIKITVNSGNYDRIEWPVKININFTELLNNKTEEGIFNENSLRLFEYDVSGNLLYAVPFQFIRGNNYNNVSNAYGLLIFQLNGSTSANQNRYYYIYFDIVENGEKEKLVFNTDLNYGIEGNKFNITNNKMIWKIDTQRAENTSGIYYVEEINNNIILNAGTNEKTAEYIEIQNNNQTYGFNLSNNFTFVENGPVRIRVVQEGYETYWNQPNNLTNKTKIIKEYIFYSNLKWIEISIKLINIANESVNRSGINASFIALDVKRTLDPSYVEVHNTTDPGSWAFAREFGGTWGVGIANYFENNTQNFFANGYGSDVGRIGIELNETKIDVNSSIEIKSVLWFDGDGVVSENDIKNLVQKLINDVDVILDEVEMIEVWVDLKTEHSIYNRNESMKITVNITYDPYNLTNYVNVTINNLTQIKLYDDGTHGDDIAGDNVFTNYYNISNNAILDVWNLSANIYASDFTFLNKTNITVNITSLLNVSTIVINKYGDVGRVVNATVDVMNYRKDKYITNADINCTFDGTEISQENITNYNNGTYLVQFYAPQLTGVYILNCSSIWNNNSGWDADKFYTEDVRTNMSIEVNQTYFLANNITIYTNQSFVFEVNITNIANGTAYNTSINLELPSQITAYDKNKTCGNVGIGESCVREFTIVVLPSTYPNNYTVNVSVEWDNKDGTNRTNKTNVYIEVTENPKLRVIEDYVDGVGVPGNETYLSNITLESYGNTNVTGITFYVYNFTNFTFYFFPNITVLESGKNKSIIINITTSQDKLSGYYYGFINITSDNDGYDRVNVTIIVSGTNMSINTNISNYTATNITWINSETFWINISTTNIGNVKAWDVNITLQLPQNFSSLPEKKICGDVYENSECYEVFRINISSGTKPGNYTINVSVVWWNKWQSIMSNKTQIDVNVLANRIVEVVEENVSDSLEHGTNKKIAILTVKSIGNERIDNVSFDIKKVDNFTFSFIFTPSLINYLDPGQTAYVDVNVSVPIYHDPGNYSAKINTTTDNDGFDETDVFIEILLNRTWSVNTTKCEKATSYSYDKVCDILVKNLGNAEIFFNITPRYANYSWPNPQNFSIEKGNSFVLSFYYNISDAPPGFHMANYTMKALNYSSSPQERIIEIVLNPYIKPIVVSIIDPKEIEQEDSVRIYANVTDRSTTGINYTTATVKRADGKVDTQEMRFIGKFGDEYYYEIYYPTDTFLGTWGSTKSKGNYTVEIYAEDNTGVNSTEIDGFYVYTGIDSILFTLFDEYERDSTGSIYFKGRDKNLTAIENLSVNFKIINPNGVVVYDQNYITNENGLIEPMPTFYIPNDAILGNYTLIAFSQYYDTFLKRYVSNETKKWNFTVKEETLPQGGLFARVETQAFWYLDSVMEFWMWILDNTGSLVDPDSMILTVYDPAENVYFNATLNDFTKESTGVYRYQYAITPNTATGSYKAELRAVKDNISTVDYDLFRITSGGPYDVRLNLLEKEVYQGDYLDFEIIIINKGEYGQDVHVEYWVSDGTTWYYNYEDVFTPPNENVTLLRSAYIFTNQPLGKYYLNVKVNYSTIMPAAKANVSFYVIEKPTVAPTPTPKRERVPAPEIELKPGMEIVEWPEEVTVEAGWGRNPVIKIKNTGDVILTGIKLIIVGIPSFWYEVQQENITLEPGKTAIFNIKLNIPASADAGEYLSSFLVFSDQNVRDEEYFKILVFRSREELIEYEIKKLETEFNEFKRDVREAKILGRDVKDIEKIIEEIEEQIVDAKEKLREKDYDGALSSVYTGWNLLRKAKKLLAEAPMTVPIIQIIIPWWVYPIIVLLIVIIFILWHYSKRIKRRLDMIIRHLRLPEARKVAKIIAEETKETLNEKEKERIIRTIELLEKEYRQGIISKDIYEELKAKQEEKLEKLRRGE